MRISAGVGLAVLLNASTIAIAGAEPAISRLEPAEPRWGGRLEVSYDTGVAGAAFRPGDPVTAVVWQWFADRVVTTAIPLQSTGRILRGSLVVEEGLGYMNLFFVTPWAYDPRADASTMIHRADGQPARGALQRRPPPNLPGVCLEELRLYPDNYWAYRDRWQQLSGGKPQAWEETIEQERSRIGQDEETAPSDYFYAASFGALALGKEEESRRILRVMAGRFPDSDLLKRALTDYHYSVYVQQLAGPGPQEVEDLERRVVLAHPRSPLAREKFRQYAHESGFPLSSLSAIHEAWIAAEPDNPTPYLGLAEGLHVRNEALPRAAVLLDRAIELMLRGTARLHGDIGGKQTDFDLPYALLRRAELASARGDHAGAVASLEAAKGLQRESDGRPHLLAGRVWTELGQETRAEEEFREAWRRGTDGAEGELRALYRRRNGSAEGVEAFLQSIDRAPAMPEDTKSAPEFRVTSLDGTTLDSSLLRGSVVVLNFWFTGCAPCVAEIPALNRLVREFRGQPVVFIALGLDDAEILKPFLRKRPFHYEVVAEAQPQHEQFDVAAYPSHVIIDSDWRTASVRRGALDEKALGAIVKRLLAERSARSAEAD